MAIALMPMIEIPALMGDMNVTSSAACESLFASLDEFVPPAQATSQPAHSVRFDAGLPKRIRRIVLAVGAGPGWLLQS